MVAFYILSPIMVLAALGVLFVRKAVHAALLLAVVMVSLAVLYLGLDAPFLFAVQIIVYTGAILMLFLFVLMLVGVDASDSVVETIRGQRMMAAIGGLVLGAVLVIGVSQVTLGTVVGLDEANRGGNIEALANILFSGYVFAFEVTSALLITAALGAMVLAHRERLTPRPTQADLAAQRVRAFSERGEHLGPLPSPGVYARHNAVGTPALLPDGTVAESSISRVLAARGTVRSSPTQLPGDVGVAAAVQRRITPDATTGPFGRSQAGSTRPGPVAGAADRAAGDVPRPDAEVVGQPADLPEKAPADPITEVLGDARRRQDDAAHDDAAPDTTEGGKP